MTQRDERPEPERHEDGIYAHPYIPGPDGRCFARVTVAYGDTRCRLAEFSAVHAARTEPPAEYRPNCDNCGYPEVLGSCRCGKVQRTEPPQPAKPRCFYPWCGVGGKFCFDCAQIERAAAPRTEPPQPATCAACNDDGGICGQCGGPEISGPVYPGGGIAFTEPRPAEPAEDFYHRDLVANWDPENHQGYINFVEHPYDSVRQVQRTAVAVYDINAAGIVIGVEIMAEGPNSAADHAQTVYDDKPIRDRSAGELGLTGRDPNCGLVHEHSPTKRCSGSET